MGHRLNDPTIWPLPTHQGIPLKTMLQSFTPSPVPYLPLSQQLVNYLLKICHLKKYLPRSFQTTLRITTRFLQKTNRLHSLQLISLISLMLSTKFYQYYYFTVAQIHQMSNHQFTNKDIHQMQQLILLTLDFNLFVEPLKVDSNQKMIKQKQFGHASVYEMLVVVMEIISILIPQDKREIFYSHALNIFTLYFHMLYTKQIKKPVLHKLCDPKIIICLILNITLIIMTQSKGHFPQIIWIKQLLKLNQTNNQNTTNFDDEYDQMLMRVMDVLFGSQMKDIKNTLKEFWIKR